MNMGFLAPTPIPEQAKGHYWQGGGLAPASVTFASHPEAFAGSRSSILKMFSLEAVPPDTTHKQ